MKKEANYYFFAASPDYAKRKDKITEHDYRNNFVRDRDRILYSKAFRRLSGKTQVFVNGYGDNIRTRLTHTLEVAQISTTITKALNLNSELAEAIALGHDLGHTPFGHVGERTLNYITNGCVDRCNHNDNLDSKEKGFKHNLQALRVVNILEEGYEADSGLNLCNYTVWGILNHTKKTYPHCNYEHDGKCLYQNNRKNCSSIKLDYYKNKKNVGYIPNDKNDWTLEGILVGVADEIAQRHHDIEDGIYSNLIDPKDLLNELEKIGFINKSRKKKLNKYLKESESVFIKKISELIIDELVSDTLNNTKRVLNKAQSLCLNKAKIQVDDYKSIRNVLYADATKNKKSITKYVGLSSKMAKINDSLKEYIKFRLQKSNTTQNMDGKASYIIKKLYKAYLLNPQQLPDKTIVSIIGDCGCKFDDKKSFRAKVGEARTKLDFYIQKDDKKFKKVLTRRICDFIAGMTDQYATNLYQDLYGILDLVNL